MPGATVEIRIATSNRWSSRRGRFRSSCRRSSGRASRPPARATWTRVAPPVTAQGTCAGHDLDHRGHRRRRCRSATSRRRCIAVDVARPAGRARVTLRPARIPEPRLRAALERVGRRAAGGLPDVPSGRGRRLREPRAFAAEARRRERGRAEGDGLRHRPLWLADGRRRSTRRRRRCATRSTT